MDEDRFGPGGRPFTHDALTDWVHANWSRDLTLREWWRRLASARLAFPSWPAAWGGADASRADLRARNTVLRDVGAIGPPTGLGVLMGAPIVLEFGNDDQRRRFLPALADGTEGWCQLFSEPDAGSDLASVSTSAVRDGDEWIVTGQKIWTSGAVHSRRGMLVARTDPSQPKHRGIGYFIIDLRQPGVEIRPIHQMNGESHFNEVFFDEARVHDADRIGPADRGWGVTVATLGFERAGLGDAEVAGGARPPAGELAGMLDRTTGSILDHYAGLPVTDVEGIARSRSLIELAREWDALDAVTRDGLARLYSAERVSSWLQTRNSHLARAGHDTSRTGTLLKLDWTERLRLARHLALQIAGPRSAAPGDWPAAAAINHFALSVPSASIAGGSDEVQRNIIAERSLGLPKDIQADHGVAFRDRLRGSASKDAKETS